MIRRLVLAVVLPALAPATTHAQGAKTRVSYDVAFNVVASPLDNCSTVGTDSLVGVLTGMEPADAHEPNVYVGTLKRTTRITTCGTRQGTNGTDVACRMTFTGSGSFDVMLTIEADSAGAWMQYIDDRTNWASLLPATRPGPSQSTVTGTCDQAEMAQLQTEYDQGETAGSPNGQPIEILRFPPSGTSQTYPAKPPISVWTFKMIRRRP